MKKVIESLLPIMWDMYVSDERRTIVWNRVRELSEKVVEKEALNEYLLRELTASDTTETRARMHNQYYCLTIYAE